jgi:transposase-like protein
MSDNSYPGSAKDDKYQDYQNSFKDDDSGNEDDIKEPRGSGSKGKKKYSVIPQSVREKFIKRVLSKEVTIKEAAKEFGLKFSTSKAILQTYKKEGRIGKKKNRERKTKILNVVFLCNVNQLNPYNSSSKGLASAEANKNKLVEQTLLNYPEHKVVHQTHLQIPHDTNKSTQQYIKDLGNDFLKDFIEKNFSANKMQQLGSLNVDMHGFNTGNGGPNAPNTVNTSSMNNSSSLTHINNLGNPQNLPSHSFNGLASLNGAPLVVPQQTFTMGSNLPQITGLSQFNQFNSHHGIHSNHLNQKRQFHSYEKDMLPEFELKNEQISDISVKKFKSGEDIFGDYDLDKSKRDLEDFIYKTHNAIKNNTYVEKTVTFDFSKYKDEFHE